MKWPKYSLQNANAIVLGDEIYIESLCASLKKTCGVDATLYAPNYLPTKSVDVMIYVNDSRPVAQWAAKHVLYLQNPYFEGSYKKLKYLRKYRYDGYIFISKKLQKRQMSDGYGGAFLPFGVDTLQYSPQKPQKKYMFDVTFVGNDFKEAARTITYLLPLMRYNFGLFGKWSDAPHPDYIQEIAPFLHNWRYSFRNWKVRHKARRSVMDLYFICRGKIPQRELPPLYSSAKININYATKDTVDWDVITLRTLEVLACGGFLMTDHIPSEDTELKKCVVVTRGGSNMIRQIDYYLAHPEERRQIAERGLRYARKYASIDDRARLLMRYIRSL